MAAPYRGCHYACRGGEYLKQGMLTALGAVGGLISAAFGGWDAALTTLVIFMGVDYLSGLAVAAVFHKSDKSEGGGLSSWAGWRGLFRKVMTLLIVLVAAQLSIITDAAFVKDTVVIAFISNEAISILENAGKMGVPIPPVILKAIDVLNKRDDSKGGK